MKNRILALTLLGFTLYWSLGWYIPSVILSSSMAVFSVLIGAAILVKYAAVFWAVVVRGVRSDQGDGAHLAAIGVPSIAASIVYGGLYVLAWNAAGQPETWLCTPAANFSRLLLIGGCVALYLTPDVQRDRLSLPAVMWLAAILLTAVFTAFVLGAYVGSDTVRGLFRPLTVSQPFCPPEMPFWEASSSSYVHGPDSPYRQLVRPRMCFRTAEKARSLGLTVLTFQ